MHGVLSQLEGVVGSVIYADMRQKVSFLRYENTKLARTRWFG